MSLRGVLDFRNLPNDPGRAAAAGAAAGAVYGSVVPGIGTAAGAAVGAIAGAITGAVNAKRARSKAKRAARQARQDAETIAAAAVGWRSDVAIVLQRRDALLAKLQAADLQVRQLPALAGPVANDLVAQRGLIMPRVRVTVALVLSVPVPTVPGAITAGQAEDATRFVQAAADRALANFDALEPKVDRLAGDAKALAAAARDRQHGGGLSGLRW